MPKHAPKGNPHGLPKKTLPDKAADIAKERAMGKRGMEKRKK